MSRKAILFMFFLTLILILIPTVAVYAGTGSQGNLQWGSRGDQVSELQQILKDKGFFPAKQRVTGYFGKITYGAVIAMEKKYGLAVDGKIGDKEWSILKGSKSRILAGYYATDYPGDKLSYNSLMNNRPLDHVAMFDFTLDRYGNLKGTPSHQGIKAAKNKGSKTVMVVHNINGGIDTKSAASAVSTYRSQLVNNIIKQVEKNGYDGVDIDIEGLSPAYRYHYSTLLEELSRYLKPRGKLLTCAIPAKTSDNGSGWNGAYDYKAIGRLADYVVIMTYDEHWASGSPGPVASMPWVNSVIKYAVSTIPSHKVLMGIGCYGYDWPSGQNAKAVRWKDIPELTGRYGNVQWDNKNSVPYLIYWKNGVKHQLWFENQYSLSIKLDLVEQYNLGGIAFWRMGFEDKTFWETVEKL